MIIKRFKQLKIIKDKDSHQYDYLPSRRNREGESAAETASCEAKVEDDEDDKTVTHILKNV